MIFTSQKKPDPEYDRWAAAMVELAAMQPGFLGVDSAQQDAAGITVSYWESTEAIRQWREHTEHKLARELGKARFYAEFSLHICRIERSYAFSAT